MKYQLYSLISVLFILGCTSQKKQTKLIFLDEYIFPNHITIDSTRIGGLSGVDFVNGTYYFAIDDSKIPRFLKAKIDIRDAKIDTVNFTAVVKLKDSTSEFYNNNHLDMESILYDAIANKIVLTSEGAIAKNKHPTIFKSTSTGSFSTNFKLPNRFLANSTSKPRHNGSFEGLSHSFNNKGYWAAMEFPLEIDGDEPSYNNSGGPIRIVYFDKETNLPTKEFAYRLAPVSRPEKGNLNLNGLTDILEYKPNQFLIIERTYQSGYEKSNIVKIFKAQLTKETTNTLKITSLNETKCISLEKELIFDFETVRNKLTDGVVDNIEGITLGPKLSNGNSSIILVSDDNFQKFGKQLNQFILLELVD